jgi:hypothetical protein
MLSRLMPSWVTTSAAAHGLARRTFSIGWKYASGDTVPIVDETGAGGPFRKFHAA